MVAFDGRLPEPAMNPRITEIFAHLQSLEDELETEIAKGRLSRGFTVKGTRVKFEKQTSRRHRGLRLGLIPFFRDMSPFNFITAPVIHSMIIPLVLFDM
jgi:hypothetical protein